jgi:YD repeat-containing protein
MRTRKTKHYRISTGNSRIRFTMFAALLVVLINSIQAQQGFNPSLQIPKPPEVAAIEKFIESPVSLHTGLHAVSVPFYNLQLRGINIPIALKYHSGGIKVDEIASETGLGWSLDAGGVISSTVHGIPDDQGDWPNSYYNEIDPLTLDYHYAGFSVPELTYQVNCPDPFNLYDFVHNSTDLSFVRGVTKGLRDSEPDVYFFSFPGNSGKFFADGTGEFRTIPYQKLDIQRLISGSAHMGYILKDTQGNQFKFTKRGTSITSINSACAAINLDGCFPPFINTYPEFHHASFHLEEIVTPYGDTIKYHYSPYAYAVQNQNQYSRMNKKLGDPFDCNTFIRPDEDVCLGRTESTTYFNTFQLDSIVTNRKQKIAFQYAVVARLDEGVKALNKIEVMIKVGQGYNTIKEFVLNHSYFVTTTDASPIAKRNHRLRLDGAGETGKPPYQFTYNQTQLPPRLSFNQDHYGFYNGKFNPHLLPKEEQYGFTVGADRNPDFTFAKAGLLTQLKYPTGGSLSFEYEANSYYSPGGEYYYTPGSAGVTSITDQVVTYNFTVQSNHIQQRLFWQNDDNGQTIHNDNCFIEITGPNNFHRTFFGDDPTNGEALSLPVGNYTMRIETIGSTYSGWIALNWLNELQMAPGNRTTAGIRIAKVKNCEAPGGNCLEQIYKYNQSDVTRSSGVIFHPPMYSHSREKTFWYLGFNECSVASVQCNPTLQSSSSITPLFNTQGAHVVYNRVEVINNDANAVGKTIHTFLVDKSLNPIYSAPPFPFVITYDWLNGLPLEVTHYKFQDNQFKKVYSSKSEYIYNEIGNRPNDLPNQFRARGVKINLYDYPQGIRVQCGQLVSYQLPPVTFEFIPYYLVSSWHYLSKVTEITYSPSSTDSLVNVTNFYHDNPQHIQLTRSTNTTSTGTLKLTRQTFPLDYAGSANQALVKLQEQHQIAPVIEQAVLKITGQDTLLLQSTLNQYSLFQVNPRVESVVSTEIAQPIPLSTFQFFDGLQADARYKSQLVIQSYDANNNPNQYIDKSDIKHVIIWDKEYNMPIAQVINSGVEGAAYTSFETKETGGWNISGTSKVQGISKTGFASCQLNSGTISKHGLTSSISYKLSFWAKSGASMTVTGYTGVPKLYPPVNDWIFHEYTISGSTSVSIQGSGFIDEVRFHPERAEMITFTHDFGKGTADITDKNGYSISYKYDQLGRLIEIIDFKSNILKRYHYNYGK